MNKKLHLKCSINIDKQLALENKELELFLNKYKGKINAKNETNKNRLKRSNMH